MIQTIFGSPVVFLKTDHVKNLFSTKLCEETVEQLMHPTNKFVEHPFTRGGKICTTDLNSKIGADPPNELHPLFEFLKKTALEYVHLFSDRPVKDLKFCNYWINLTFQGCEIKNHNDSNSSEKSLIVTFYPKVPRGGKRWWDTWVKHMNIASNSKWTLGTGYIQTCNASVQQCWQNYVYCETEPGKFVEWDPMIIDEKDWAALAEGN